MHETNGFLSELIENFCLVFLLATIFYSVFPKHESVCTLPRTSVNIFLHAKEKPF